MAILVKSRGYPDQYQTWYSLYPSNLKCTTKRLFAIACFGKRQVSIFKFPFISKKVILKYSVFGRVEKESKSNQTWQGVFSMFLEARKQGSIATIWLGKSQFSIRKLLINSVKFFLKYSLFGQVKLVWSASFILRV